MVVAVPVVARRELPCPRDVNPDGELETWADERVRAYANEFVKAHGTRDCNL